MKNLLTQWKTEEENLKTNLIKNLLTKWETEEENQKTGGDIWLIYRELRDSQNLKMILNVYLSQSSQNW